MSEVPPDAPCLGGGEVFDTEGSRAGGAASCPGRGEREKGAGEVNGRSSRERPLGHPPGTTNKGITHNFRPRAFIVLVTWCLGIILITHGEPAVQMSALHA